MANIINGSVIPSLQVGNRIFTDLSNLIQLYACVNGASLGFSCARISGASAGYQVTSGKSLVIEAVQITIKTSGQISFMYADNDTGFQSNTSPTNIVYNSASSSNLIDGLTAGTVYTFAQKFIIPSQKYVYLYNGGSSAAYQVTLYGYEV